MLKINKQSITLTKGDDASLRLVPRYKDKTIYTVQEGDSAIFRLKVGASVKELECVINLENNKIVANFTPADTAEFEPGIYRYEAELITSLGFHYTFIADQPFILGNEIEQRISNATSANGNSNGNYPEIDGEIGDEPVVNGDIQPTNPMLDYEELNHLPKLNGKTIKGDKDNEYYGIPTKLSEMDNDDNYVQDEDYQHTDNNYDDTDKGKVDALGTASTYDVAESGNASTSQVVKGDDTRLTDARPASDVSDWAKQPTKPSYNASEISGLGTAAVKDFTTSVIEDSADLVTSGAVKSAIDSAVSSLYKPAGNKTCAELVSALLIQANLGNTYNMSDSGVTTADFVEGAGHPINVGDNVAIVEVSGAYKFDILSGMVDLSNYVQKSATSGLIKNDGSIDPTAYAKQSEMSVTDGTGIDADKTTIQLKNGTSATVLKTHQDISGKVDKVAGKDLSTNDFTDDLKDKLDGITTGANKVESSETNGNIKIDDTETPVYDDTAIKNALSTATQTVEGNPLSFTTLSAQTAESTLIDLEPIQDLHGYDYPWVGGAWKNLLPMTVAGIKSANTAGTWTDNAYTRNGVTFTILTDDDENVIGVKVTGTAIANTNLMIEDSNSLLNGLAGKEVIMNGCPSGGSEGTYSLIRYSADVEPINAYDTGSGVTYTYPQTMTTHNVRITIFSGFSIPTAGIIFYPMIRLATETDATFAPYTNLCPITGRTQVGIEGCGKNLIDSSNAISGLINPNIGSSIDDVITSTRYSHSVAIDAKDGLVVSAKSKDISIFNYLLVMMYNNDKLAANYPMDFTNTTSTKSYIVQSNMYEKVCLNYGAPAGVRVGTDIQGYIQLELGSTATPYEPYTQSNNLTIQFGQTVYGGTLDVEDGVLRVLNIRVLAKDLNWSKHTTGVNNVYYTSDLQSSIKKPVNSQTALDDFICSDYETTSWDYLFSAHRIGIGVNADGRIAIGNENITQLTDFTNSIQDTQICYPLAIPTEIQLTPHQISLLKGVNNISTDGDSITLTYRDGSVATLADVKALGDNLTQEIADSQILTDTVTGDKYRLIVTNGVLDIQQVSN